MPDLSASTVVIAIALVVALLVLLISMLQGISRRLGRIEKCLVEAEDARGSGGGAPSSSETSAGGAFEVFLSEDPERRKLPKSEKFAQYRRWRHKNKMNWPEV